MGYPTHEKSKDPKKGAGFTVTFPTEDLSACGMILYLTLPEGCPKHWNLLFISEDGKKEIIDYALAETGNGLQISFELPAACIGLPIANLHLESVEDCPGGTVQITTIRLYGENAE